MVTHLGMINHLHAMIEALDLKESDKMAQTASQCFDISVWQFFALPLVGGLTYIFSDDVAHDLIRLFRQIALQNISVLEIVPSLLRIWLNYYKELEGDKSFVLPALRWLIPTGEPLPLDLCQRWFQAYQYIPIINAYGPTECADDVTLPFIDHNFSNRTANVPIGRPIANAHVYILDRHLSLPYRDTWRDLHWRDLPGPWLFE